MLRTAASAATGSIANTLAINGDRLMQMMTDVGAIGALPNGGVRRLAFSQIGRAHV